MAPVVFLAAIAAHSTDDQTWTWLLAGWLLVVIPLVWKRLSFRSVGLLLRHTEGGPVLEITGDVEHRDWQLSTISSITAALGPGDARSALSLTSPNGGAYHLEVDEGKKLRTFFEEISEHGDWPKCEIPSTYRAIQQSPAFLLFPIFGWKRPWISRELSEIWGAQQRQISEFLATGSVSETYRIDTLELSLVHIRELHRRQRYNWLISTVVVAAILLLFTLLSAASTLSS